MVVMELLVMRQWSQYFHYVFVVQYLSLQQTLSKLQREGGREREREREKERDGERVREMRKEGESIKCCFTVCITTHSVPCVQFAVPC